MQFEEEIRSHGPKDHEAQESFPRRHYPDRVRGYLLSPAFGEAPLFQLFLFNHFSPPTANRIHSCCKIDAKNSSPKVDHPRAGLGFRRSYRVPEFLPHFAANFPPQGDTLGKELRFIPIANDGSKAPPF